ncbi:MAG: hypothetical protein V3T70_00130, partial [Phycisphaerae bacterium]
FLFIPVFFRLNCTTIYEFLRHRFGPATRYTASVFFFVTRLIASGIRLYVAAMAVAIIFGWYRTGQSDKTGIILAIAVFSFIGIAFIAFGGIKAVIWTNVLQAGVFILGGAATVGYLYWRIDGGLAVVLDTARDAGRLEVFNWSWDADDPNMFWLMALNGFFVSLAVFGTDHDMMQRLLTVKSRRASQRSLLATIVVALPTVTLFLAVGTLLFVFYHQNPSLAVPPGNRLDEAFPNFIAAVMPPVLKGLLLLTVVMASIDSPLGSLSASFVTDIYRPLIRRDAPERHYLLVSRLSVVGFGVLLGLLAIAASGLDRLLWTAFAILGITGGSLLGIFLLGLLTRRGRDKPNAVVMIANAALMTLLYVLIQLGKLPIGWTWLIVIGTGLTFVAAAVPASRVRPTDSNDYGFPVGDAPGDDDA